MGIYNPPAGTSLVAPTLQIFNQTNYYTFTVSSATTTAGQVYSNNGSQFTTVYAINSGNTLVAYKSSGTNAPTSSGTLTYVSGTDTGNISYSALGTNGTYFPTSSNVLGIQVEIVGGGGSGGSVNSLASTSASGGGGGGGGYVRKLITGSALAAIITSGELFNIGAGGAAPASGSNPGNTGGTTTFGSSFLTAIGGGPGGSGNASAAFEYAGGGSGGAASGGDVNTNGSAGFPGITGALTQGWAGAGGFNPLSAAAVLGANSSANGTSGLGYGGGGSGAANTNNGGAFSGGAGANGVILIYEFYA
jgi:hypothetical protein